jgi:hypothetical protein
MIPLSDIADGICAAVLDQGGNRATGRLVGRPETCIRRYGANPQAWPADALLHLAAAHPDLRRAVVAFISPDHKSQEGGQSVSAESDARSAVAEMGAQISGLMTDLRDGRMAPQEARKRAPEIEALIESLETLRLDLVAKGKAVRP